MSWNVLVPVHIPSISSLVSSLIKELWELFRAGDADPDIIPEETTREGGKSKGEFNSEVGVPGDWGRAPNCKGEFNGEVGVPGPNVEGVFEEAGDDLWGEQLIANPLRTIILPTSWPDVSFMDTLWNSPSSFTTSISHLSFTTCS